MIEVRIVAVVLWRVVICRSKIVKLALDPLVDFVGLCLVVVHGGATHGL